ncbi:hypothetical protein [Streptomyces sp. NPDC018947]|uniref:hypothetical protein n=1 Tax=Streptomyces sp. NPDC018947 TaxID=3365054 RepID=UPI0037984A20
MRLITGDRIDVGAADEDRGARRYGWFSSRTFGAATRVDDLGREFRPSFTILRPSSCRSSRGARKSM